MDNYQFDWGKYGVDKGRLQSVRLGRTTTMLSEAIETAVRGRDCVVISGNWEHLGRMRDSLLWLLSVTEINLDSEGSDRTRCKIERGGTIHFVLHPKVSGGPREILGGRTLEAYTDHFTYEVLGRLRYGRGGERHSFDPKDYPGHPNRKKLFLEGWEPRPPIDQPSTTGGEE